MAGEAGTGGLAYEARHLFDPFQSFMARNCHFMKNCGLSRGCAAVVQDMGYSVCSGWIVLCFWTVYRGRKAAFPYCLCDHQQKILFFHSGKFDVLDRNTMPSSHLTTGKNKRGTIIFGNSALASSFYMFSKTSGILQLKNIVQVDRVPFNESVLMGCGLVLFRER